MNPKILLLAVVTILTGCQKQEPADFEKSTPTRLAPFPLETIAAFSGEKTFAHVQALTDFGPRPPESEAYQKSLAYLEKFLADHGWKTQRQTFQSKTPIGPITFTNLLARYSPDGDPDWEQSPPVLIGSHLDTKRYVEFRFVGANDSGSSTGALLELARVLTPHPEAARNVELIFFDGEEAILENIRGNDGLYGSRFYASQLVRRPVQPQLGIVLDIVGDADIDLLIGGDSAKSLTDLTLTAAKSLNLQDWVRAYPDSITDDHVPLMVRANLPVLHLIGDFQKSGYWHTPNDTMDNLESHALENIGKLTLLILHLLAK